MSRTFSQSEQVFLKKIVKYNEQQIDNKIFLYEISSFMVEQIIDNEWIEINDYIIPVPNIRHYKKITINVPKGYSVDSAFSVYYAFYEIIFLLSWLEDFHFVSFSPYTDVGCGEQICKSKDPERNEYIPFKIPQDNQFVDKVCRLFLGKCFVNKTLKEFVANNFKTKEDQEVENSLAEARKANKIAWWAIGITAIVGICQILIGAIQIIKSK